MINHRGRPGLQSSWLDDQLCGFTPRLPLLPDGGGATAGKEEDFGLNVASLGVMGETRTVQLSSEIKSRAQGETDEHQRLDVKFRCVQSSCVFVDLVSEECR